MITRLRANSGQADLPDVCRTALFPWNKSRIIGIEGYRKGCPAMQERGIDKKKIRDELKIKRNRLLGEYSRNPMDTHLAIEIKLIDDQLAKLTEQLVQERKSGLD